ncbi:FtsX-like permease family protein [Buchnera aphidicola (Aphis craccivora)]|uniref:ABC transporter permease n=1 Tax=Buchnera aphidicola (Aphis craccivora) TaxID=466616 RepID=A0A4D6XPQ3_9GAMM|nr:ABC transporter permease [Buchnera aphidicola]QCI16540.1 FtsX-like permease family protein [Buchnera aphidicola (Aphis craccivora)]QLL40674.1 FtsX-like permease family protein [Buchnera aphidicola (Aphis craccivore)]WAI17512.1 MAG: ABC transporter permease [Buchnera aphidicola (Aphis craccivora)]
MYKPIYLFIGLRYLWNSRLTSFKKIITVLSIIGISIGILSIIITLSLVNGFQNEFKKNILSFIPHLIITNKNYYINESDFPKDILKLQNIQKVSSFISSKVLIKNKKNIGIGEIVAFKENNYNFFRNYNIKNILYTLNSQENNIIIGKQLAKKLNINVNDLIKLIVFPNSKKNLLTKKFNEKIFKVTGFFSTNNEIDNYQILINTQIALNFLHYYNNYVTGWRIWLKDPFSFNINIFETKKNNLLFLDWQLKQGELFKAVQIERYITLLFFISILLVVGLNVVITLTVNMIEKKNIIAILQTQGLCRKKIMLIFITLGSSTTVIGNLLGTLISFVLILQKNFLNLLTNIFFNDISIPIEIFPFQIFLINIIFISISILSTLYPIWSITKSTPSKILSNE